MRANPLPKSIIGGEPSVSQGLRGRGDGQSINRLGETAKNSSNECAVSPTPKQRLCLGFETENLAHAERELVLRIRRL
jgi:hypothetical protein